MKTHVALAAVAALLTASLLHAHPQSQLFEYACHEGNEGMRNMLKVVQDAEKTPR